MKYFETEKVNRHITCIKGLTGELMYLIEGGTSAALIDTGLGVGNIRQLAESLTTLPCIVLLTHGHLDHAGGAFLYESVYLNPKDTSLLLGSGDVEPRKDYLESMIAGKRIPIEAYTSYRDVRILPIRDGMLFDLGGLTIEAVDFPGHTPGSMAFLIKEERVLITGDACNSRTFLFLPGCLSIEEYQKNVAGVMARSGEYDRVFLSHVQYEVPKSVLQDVYDCCTDILSGAADDIPFEFMGKGGAVLAKAIGIDGARLDGRCGNIVYSKQNIRKNKQ